MKKIFLIYLFATSINSFAQEDDLLKMVEETQPVKNEKVFATFKTLKIVNAQTTETVKAKTMDFRITHRFGNIGAHSGGGIHQLYGFDAIADVRISFDFGITNKIQLGVGRSSRSENLDASIKWRFLEQTTNNKVPVSVCLYSDMIFTPMSQAQLYAGTQNVTYNIAHRASYISQLLIARKFNSWLSLELLPTYSHRNFVRAYVNPDNGKTEDNDIYALGFGGRIKITKRAAITFDYFQVFSQYRNGSTETTTYKKFYPPLGIGFELDTGGHVFHLNLTNASGIIEGDFIPYTNDNWLAGGFKFGFNISRVFNLTKR